MNFFKKLFRKSPPPSFQQEFEELLTYELDENYDHVTPLIQAHKSVEHFNYNLAVSWAISLIEKGNETPNVLMLASFGGQIDVYEIMPYVTAVLNDFGLNEIEGDEAVLVEIRYYVIEILKNRSVIHNLTILYNLGHHYEFDLMPLYLLYYAWDDLESGYETYYYDGATKDNIESLIKKEAANWLALNAEKSVPLK